MKHIESLSLIKQKMCAPQVAEHKEDMSEEIVEFDVGNSSPSIDILSWIDSHGVELKDATQIEKIENRNCISGDLQDKLSTKIFHVKATPAAIQVEIKSEAKTPEADNFAENTVIDSGSWIEEDDSWNRSIDPDHWFQRSIEKQTEIVHEVSVERNDSFEDEHCSISESKEIMEHLDQHGISLKPADFEKKRVRGEVGVHRSKGAVEKTVDLHGMHVRDAELKLIQTFEDSKIRGYQQILIVHGKGNHSSGGDSKMKRMVVDLLEGPLAEKVASFTFAPFDEGGGGASRVILK